MSNRNITNKSIKTAIADTVIITFEEKKTITPKYFTLLNQLT